MNAGQLSSLEDSSFFYILLNFERFPPKRVALLPTRIRAKLFLHLPLADVCQLEGTPAVEGIDMNEVWREAVTYASKLKGSSIPEVEAKLELVMIGYGIANTNQLWEEISRRNFAAACPSTRKELQRGQGYKQFCNEMMFEDIIFNHYGSYYPDLFRQRSGLLTIHELLVTLRCCCGPSHPLVSLPSETTHPQVHGVVPSRYSTVASSGEELLKLALSCFGSPNRLRLWGFWFPSVDEQYLADELVIGNLEELSVGLWGEVYANKLNKLLSSTKKLVSLHIEFYRFQSEYDLLEDEEGLDKLDVQSLPPSLRKVHIENPGRYLLEPLLPLASFLSHQPDIQLIISGGEAAAPLVSELVNQTLDPTPLHFQYTSGSWSYTSDHQSIILENVCVPESLLKRHNFTRLGRKRQREEMDD